ncbi:MAG: hypothetical protein V4819_18425 [Verrucomicrobiota bacterium]
MKIISLLVPLSLLVAQSHAAVIYSGLKDFIITTNFDGIYLDVDAGNLVAIDTVGWDINPFFGGEGIANSPSFHPVAATVALDAPVLNLTSGQTVDGSSLFASTYPGGYSSSAIHVGNSAGQFVSGSEGYIGFSITTNDSLGPYFGWMRVVLANNGSTGLIRDWAYEDSGLGITTGTATSAIPEPTVLTLGLVCAAGFTLRRRRS